MIRVREKFLSRELRRVRRLFSSHPPSLLLSNIARNSNVSSCFSFRCQPFLLMRLRSHFRFLPDFLFSNLHANLNTYFQGRVLIIPSYDVVLYTPKSPSQTHKLHDSLSIKIESSRLQDLTHKLCAAPLPKLIFKRHLKFWLHWNLFRQANVKLTVRDYASLAWIYSCLFVRLF